MKKILLFKLLLSIFNFTKFLSVDEVFEPADRDKYFSGKIIVPILFLPVDEVFETVDSDKSFIDFKNRLEEKINYLEKNEKLRIAIRFDENKSCGEEAEELIFFINCFLNEDETIKNVILCYSIYFDSKEKLLKYVDIIINSSKHIDYKEIKKKFRNH